MASFHRIGPFSRFFKLVAAIQPSIQSENSAPKGRRNRRKYFRGAVDLDKGTVAARAQVVDRSRNEFLPGARLS